ncbi:MAG: DJ-1/PfpI family protein [Candidatus Babeliales bacterium]
MVPQHKKILFVLMPTGYQDFEFRVPYNALIAQHHAVTVAGFTNQPALGAFGDTFTPDVVLGSLNDVDLSNYDALIITGGPGSTEHLWNNEALQKIVRAFHEQKKLVATICYACAVPAQAGILANKTVTIYPTDEAKALFAEHSVTFSDQGCVVLEDESIITAQGPTFAKQFAQEIIKFLQP